MRPLFHPPREEISVEGVLHALSDPVRAQILIELINRACGQKCAAFTNLFAKPLPKSTLSQHFRILREAGLIRSQRQGVQLTNTLRCDDMPETICGLVESVLNSYAAQMQGKKTRKPKRAA